MEQEQLKEIVKEVIAHIAPKCGMKLHTVEHEPLKLQDFSNSGAFSYPLRASVGDFVVDNTGDVYLVKSVYFCNKVCDITMMKVGRDEASVSSDSNIEKVTDNPTDNSEKVAEQKVTEEVKKTTKKSKKSKK